MSRRPLLLLPLLALLAQGCASTPPARTELPPEASSPAEPVTASLHHIVLVWLKPSTPPAVAAQLLAQTRSLACLPGIRALAAGPAVASERPIVDDSFDFAVRMEFSDRAAMDAYLAHPQHRAFVEHHLKPNLERLVAYDFEG